MNACQLSNGNVPARSLEISVLRALSEKDAMVDVEMLAFIIVAFAIAAGYARMCSGLLPPARAALQKYRHHT
jgi:hypothetical protein